MKTRSTGNATLDRTKDALVTIEKGAVPIFRTGRAKGAWYAVTFPLWDSLPQQVIESWLFERKNIVKTAEQMKRPLSKHEEDRLRYLYSEKVERFLDAGYGSCFMKDGRIARRVANALLHFEGQRYNLAAWCVMPNHVHAVVQPFAGIVNTGGTLVPLSELPNILHPGSRSLQKKLTNC